VHPPACSDRGPQAGQGVRCSRHRRGVHGRKHRPPRKFEGVWLPLNPAPEELQPALKPLNPSNPAELLWLKSDLQVGGYVAKALIEAGYSVRAAVGNRASARVDYLRDMGCTIVVLPDVLEEEGWVEAVAGCAGLILVEPPTPKPAPHTLSPEPRTRNPKP
jgi:hypothetical protein